MQSLPKANFEAELNPNFNDKKTYVYKKKVCTT